MVQENSAKKLVHLTDYFISLPKGQYSFALIVVVGIVFGLVIRLTQLFQTFDNISDLLPQIIVEGVGYGIFVLSVPALLSAFTCWIIKRELILRRMLFLSFVGSLVYAIFYFASIVLSRFNVGILPSGNVIYVAYGLVFVTWLFIAKIMLGLRYSSLLFALVQLTYNTMFLVASGLIIGVGNDPLALMVKVYFSSFIFLVAIYAIFVLINAPMKRNFGVSSIDAATLFFAQWFKHSREIEGIFDTVGEDIETLVGVVAFKTKEGLKAIFVVPYLHFGPFGNLGGSEFPAIISRSLEKEYNASVFVFHGTATHDFNPVSSEEVNAVVEGCRNSLSRMKYRRVMAGFSSGKSGTCKAYNFTLNDFAFVGLTRAPRTTEDIDFSLGLAYRNQVISKGFRDALIVDCHNAETGEIMRVDSGNPIGFEFMSAIDQAFSAKNELKSLKLGVAGDRMEGFGFENGIAGNGIKVAIFQTASFKYAMVVIDGNSMIPGFRRELIDRVLSTGLDDCEVFTTDTHAVNTVNGVLNPVGLRKKEEILERVIKCVNTAGKNMEEVEADMQVDKIKTRVFGVKQSSELVGTVNSVVAIARIIVPLILIASVLAVLWGLTKF
ncbi:DUF2070 family protein [Candidatus Micrarchaeota archaeon]|nr:DUF2070 family protein [Candidatus Micrarchaeota archaeon]